MPRSLNETQKRRWRELGEMLLPRMAAPAREELLAGEPAPAVAVMLPEAVTLAASAVQEPGVAEPVTAEAQSPHVEEQVSFTAEELSQPEAAETQAAPSETDFEEVFAELPEAPRERIAADWREFAEVPASQFFASAAWDLEPGALPLPLPLAAVPVRPIAAPSVSLSVSVREFLSHSVPWQARGMAPQGSDALDLAPLSAAPTLHSIMEAATQTALHAARKMAGASRTGSATAFFSQLTWQREVAA